jgi:hypothetical protein
MKIKYRIMKRRVKNRKKEEKEKKETAHHENLPLRPKRQF